MTNVVNLNKARKARLKQEKAKAAQRNRVAFGVAGKLRNAEKERLTQEAKRLDGHALNSRHEMKKD